MRLETDGRVEGQHHHLDLLESRTQTDCRQYVLMKFTRFAILLSLFWVPASFAQPLNFFGASIPVKAQTSTERSRAAKEGFKQVLVRVSGSRDVVDSPEIQSLLSSASQFMEQYYYQLEELEDGDKQERMTMSFSPTQVRRVLSEAGLPVWPTNRPKALLWLVEDSVDNGKQFVTSFDSPVARGLEAAANERGIPLSFPLMDLDDQLALPVDQVWGMDEKAILEASERYKGDTVLVGRYTQTSKGQWWGTWMYFHRGQNRVYDLRTDEGGAQGYQAVEPLADYLASLYSVTRTADGGSSLYVRVTDLESFGDYRGVLDYLDKLTVVGSVSKVSYTNGSLLLGLKLVGDVDQLHSSFSLDRKLSLVKEQNPEAMPWLQAPEGTLNSPLIFRWKK